jgi:hypothetical protein
MSGAKNESTQSLFTTLLSIGYLLYNRFLYVVSLFSVVDS